MEKDEGLLEKDEGLLSSSFSLLLRNSVTLSACDE